MKGERRALDPTATSVNRVIVVDVWLTVRMTVHIMGVKIISLKTPTLNRTPKPHPKPPLVRRHQELHGCSS